MELVKEQALIAIGSFDKVQADSELSQGRIRALSGGEIL